MSMPRVRLLAVMLSIGGCTGQPQRSAVSARTDPVVIHSSASARTAGWVLVAVGAEVGAVALGTSAMMLHSNGVRSDACGANRTCSAEGLDANDRLKDLAPWNAGAWIIAAAGLGGGLFLVLSNPRDKTTVGMGPGPGGALLRTTF